MDLNMFSQAVDLTPNEVMAAFQQLEAEGFLHKVGTGYSPTEKGRNALKIADQVPEGREFNFYVDEGKPLGFSAHSIEEFYRLVKQVTSDSLEFHLHRKDFENWIREVVGDRQLPLDISGVRGAELKGEDLRKGILNAIDLRYGVGELE
jgi:DNA-binding transcriptional regulator YhcF (GntR family)